MARRPLLLDAMRHEIAPGLVSLSPHSSPRGFLAYHSQTAAARNSDTLVSENRLGAAAAGRSSWMNEREGTSGGWGGALSRGVKRKFVADGAHSEAIGAAQPAEHAALVAAAAALEEAAGALEAVAVVGGGAGFLH